MDIADIANERAELHLERALRNQVGKSAPESHPDFNGADCVDCAEQIPAQRLQLGKVRCIGCQQILESKRSRGLA